MKKQFFYAAMAVALMASCTSEDDLAVNPVDPNQDEEQVALNLSVAAPSMTVGSRATGTGIVGDVVDNLQQTPSKTWDSQRLYMTMVNRSNGGQYKVDNKLYFEGLEFRAPKASDFGADQNIRIYSSYQGDGHGSDQGTLQYKYYPITGQYDFYGWHIDAATWDNDTTFNATTAMVNNITIDGTQDIMAAKTLPIPTQRPADGEAYKAASDAITDDNTYADMVAKQFSARTARNNFTPVLNFKHSLARLKFFVRSGKGSDAATHWMGEDGNAAQKREVYDNLDAAWTDGEGIYKKYAAYADGAIYVTEVKVLDMVQNINLNLMTQAAEVANGNTNKEFTLMSTPAQAGVHDTKTLQTLAYTAPKYAWGYAGDDFDTDGDQTINNSEGKEATEVGESVMFLPNAEDGTNKKIKIQVKVGQCLLDTENETSGDVTYIWDEPAATTLWVDASKLTIDGYPVPTEKQVFAAGNSYNVYITIYGREQIEVSASLVPWVDGGDTDTDIEDDVVVEGEEDETETITATINVSGLTQGVEATVTLSDQQTSTVSADENGQATFTFTVNKSTAYTYTVTADGYAIQAGDGSIDASTENVTEEVVMTATQTKNVVFTITGLGGGETATITIGEDLRTGESEVTFTDLAKQEATYTATATGYFNESGSIEADATTATVNFVKEKAFTISITGEIDGKAIELKAVNGKDAVIGDNLISENKADLTVDQKYAFVVDGEKKETFTIEASAELELTLNVE